MFNQVFTSTPTLSCDSVNELVDHSQSKITTIIDSIAPTKVKVVSGMKKSLQLHWLGAEEGSVEKAKGGDERLPWFIMSSIKRKCTDKTNN